MPQSLTVGSASSSGSSTKRQRSVDSREVQTRPTSVGGRRSNGSMSRSTVRIPSYLDKSKGEISQAFQDLEWKQRFRLFHALENPTTSPFRVDRSEVTISRNRYGNVQPWDNSRIKLQPPIAGSNYVNASPISLRSRGTKTQSDAHNGGNQEETSPSEIKYVATQGPKDGVTSHFWHMVMQETTGDTGVIVMLTQCYEANREKCAQYFPSSMNNPTMILQRDEDKDDKGSPENVDQATPKTPDRKYSYLGQLVNQMLRYAQGTAPQDIVTLKSISEDTKTGSLLRIFTLTIDNESKTIYHYLYRGWPDFGKPEADDRIALLELTRQTRKIANGSPRFVHCSAGVGRTGTFIALDFLLHEIEEGRLPDANAPSEPTGYIDTPTPTSIVETWGRSGPPKVKTPTGNEFPSGEENHALKDDVIYETVNTLREQRMMMVMNELQYSFLYEVVREVFLEKYKARPEGAMVKGVETGSTDLPRGKTVKVEGEDSDDEDGERSGSEAETEIMEGDGEAAEKMRLEQDPYAVVAPEHIRGGVAREMS